MFVRNYSISRWQNGLFKVNLHDKFIYFGGMSGSLKEIPLCSTLTAHEPTISEPSYLPGADVEVGPHATTVSYFKGYYHKKNRNYYTKQLLHVGKQENLESAGGPISGSQSFIVFCFFTSVVPATIQ